MMRANRASDLLGICPEYGQPEEPQEKRFAEWLDALQPPVCSPKEIQCEIKRRDLDEASHRSVPTNHA